MSKGVPTSSFELVWGLLKAPMIPESFDDLHSIGHERSDELRRRGFTFSSDRMMGALSGEGEPDAATELTEFYTEPEDYNADDVIDFFGHYLSPDLVESPVEGRREQQGSAYKPGYEIGLGEVPRIFADYDSNKGRYGDAYGDDEMDEDYPLSEDEYSSLLEALATMMAHNDDGELHHRDRGVIQPNASLIGEDMRSRAL